MRHIQYHEVVNPRAGTQDLRATIPDRALVLPQVWF